MNVRFLRFYLISAAGAIAWAGAAIVRLVDGPPWLLAVFSLLSMLMPLAMALLLGEWLKLRHIVSSAVALGGDVETVVKNGTTISAAGVTADQLRVLSKIVARGRFGPEEVILLRQYGILPEPPTIAPIGQALNHADLQILWDLHVKPTQDDSAPPQSYETRALMGLLRWATFYMPQQAE